MGAATKRRLATPAQKAAETRRLNQARAAATTLRRSEASKRAWTERRAQEAERHERAVAAAQKSAATRAANRARAAATHQRRSEAAHRAWTEKKTLSPVQLGKLRETRRLDRERQRYEYAERKAIQAEERRQDLAAIKELGKVERAALSKATEGILAARIDRTRSRRKEQGKVHLDRLEALGYRRDLVRKGISESVLLKVDIKNSFAVQQLAASLGVTPHSIYTMRLSPKATGGKATMAQARQARLELSGGK